jgi:hypothetical protein
MVEKNGCRLEIFSATFILIRFVAAVEQNKAHTYQTTRLAQKSPFHVEIILIHF